MNVERFHAIVIALLEEVQASEYPHLLEQLASGLKSAVQDPNQPDPQQQVSQIRGNLDSILREAPSNDFSPAWRDALKELGVAVLVGNALADRLEDIFSRNEITPSAAAEEIGDIQERVQEFAQALNNASAGLEFFDIGAEELEPGEFEIGFLIPREAVDEDLAELGREFVRIKRIVAPVSELAGEGRPDLHVRSIASSGFEVFLYSAPGVAWAFAKILDTLLSSYQKILDIRQKHRELAEDDGVPDEVLKDLAEYATDLMGERIEEIVNEAISEATLEDAERLNELRTELTLQLNALAERVDRGYNVEVRTGKLPSPSDDDDEETPAVTLDAETQAAAEAVLAKQKGLQFMNVTGKPILRLEQPEEPPDEGTDEDAADTKGG